MRRWMMLALVAGCATTDDATEPNELGKMMDFVNSRVDPASVKLTLRTKEGRRIDCIDRATQPSLHGGALEAPPERTFFDASLDPDLV